MGSRNQQLRSLEYQCIKHLLAKKSIHYVRNQAEDALLNHADFAHLYSETLGRCSRNPVTLKKVILLMQYNGVSNREAEASVRFDNH